MGSVDRRTVFATQSLQRTDRKALFPATRQYTRTRQDPLNGSLRRSKEATASFEIHLLMGLVLESFSLNLCRENALREVFARNGVAAIGNPLFDPIDALTSQQLACGAHLGRQHDNGFGSGNVGDVGSSHDHVLFSLCPEQRSASAKGTGLAAVLA